MPRINPHKQAVNTRNLYDFEDGFFNHKDYRYLLKQQSKKVLLELAHTVWSNEHINIPLPEIRFGKGIRHNNGEYVSWCNGPVIELAQGQRDVITLLHELAHAVGHYLHNHKFVGTYIKYLTTYTDIDITILVNTMHTYKVDIPKEYTKQHIQR